MSYSTALTVWNEPDTLPKLRSEQLILLSYYKLVQLDSELTITKKELTMEREKLDKMKWTIEEVRTQQLLIDSLNFRIHDLNNDIAKLKKQRRQLITACIVSGVITVVTVYLTLS
jgi:hypothetical protein